VFIYSIAKKTYRSSRLAAIFVKGLMTQGFLLDDEKMRDSGIFTIAWPQATLRIIREKYFAILLFRGGGRFLHSLGQPLHLAAV
jgi:hypothetical protein